MRLRRLKIDQYRSVVPGTELVFNDTWNVLLGQNGTGKTTLLNLIAMVVASDFSPLKDEPVAIEYEFSYSGAGTVVVRLQNLRQESDVERSRSALEPEIGGAFELLSSKEESLSWSYRLTVQIEGAPAPWEVTSNPVAATMRTPRNSGTLKPFLVVSPFTSEFLGIILEVLNLNGFDNAVVKAWVAVKKAEMKASMNAARFDEGLGIFSAITGTHPANGRESIHPASSTVGVMRDATESTRHYFPKKTGIVPQVILEHLRTTPERKDESQPERIDFLKRTAAVLGFSYVDLTRDLLQKKVSHGTERYTFGNFGFRLTLDDGSIINHTLLSYGQKRLLAFFYYLAANPDIAIADELVNGLHYDWIEVCLEEIGDRQAFLTSQNPLLLDFLPFDSAEDVQRSFLLCRREKRDGKTQTVWANLDEESARSFFRAYETQAQQVSEILRSKGLW